MPSVRLKIHSSQWVLLLRVPRILRFICAVLGFQILNFKFEISPKLTFQALTPDQSRVLLKKTITSMNYFSSIQHPSSAPSTHLPPEQVSNSHFEEISDLPAHGVSDSLRSQRHRNSQHNNHCTSITTCWQAGGLPHIMRIAGVTPSCRRQCFRCDNVS